MTYRVDSNLNRPINQREREMLTAGFSYAEVAQALGVSHKALADRNQVVYRIDQRAAFARRIERDGIPCRLNVSDAFGHWFSGFFDGEGHIGVFSRPMRNGYTERRLSMQIIIRDDDAQVIHYIKDNIGAGIVYANKGHGRTNPNTTFRIEKIKDLAEIAVPLFEKYPLHTKKAREFAIWRDLVRLQYVWTMGGYSQRASTTQEQAAAFDAGLQAIKHIRTYTIATNTIE